MDKAQLVLDAIKLASGLIAFARQNAADDATLKAIIAKAHQEGRQVDGTDVRASLDAMDDARVALEAKLSGT